MYVLMHVIVIVCCCVFCLRCSVFCIFCCAVVCVFVMLVRVCFCNGLFVVVVVVVFFWGGCSLCVLFVVLFPALCVLYIDMYVNLCLGGLFLLVVFWLFVLLCLCKCLCTRVPYLFYMCIMLLRFVSVFGCAAFFVCFVCVCL